MSKINSSSDIFFTELNNSEDLRKVINQKKCVAYFMEDEPPLIGLIDPFFDFEDNDSDEDLPF